VARRSKREALATRASILDAAEWCFRTQGVSATSLAQIAARAQCSRGAIYWHFAEPLDILRGVLARGQPPLLPILETVADAPPPLLPTLQHSLLQCLRTIDQNPHMRSVLEIIVYRCDFAGDRAPILDTWRADLERILGLLRRILERAQQAGELRHGLNAAGCASLIGFALLGVLDCALLAAQPSSLEQAARAPLDTAFASLAAQP